MQGYKERNISNHKINNMENRKWLKRKYPKTFKEFSNILNDQELAYFKKRK